MLVISFSLTVAPISAHALQTQTITTPQYRYGVSTNHANFNINAKAMTDMTYESSNTSVATVSSTGVVDVKSAGIAYVTITAAESDVYEEATKKVKIDVRKYKPTSGGVMQAKLNFDHKSGDSRGNEISISRYEYNKNPSIFNWKFIIRCTDPAVSDKAATAVYYICKNNHFGYNDHKPTSQKSVNKRRSIYDAVHKKLGDNPSKRELKKILKIKKKANTSCTPTLLAGYWLYIDMDTKIKAKWRKPYHKKAYVYNCGSVNIEQDGLRRAIKKVNAEYRAQGKLEPFEIINVSSSKRNSYFSKKRIKKTLKRGDILGGYKNLSHNGHSVMMR